MRRVVSAKLATLIGPVLLLAGVQAACSFYAAAEGSADGGPPDAADVSVAESGSNDDAGATSDGDAGTTADAPTDADAGDLDCPAGAVLCSSFDDASPMQGWSQVLQGAEALVEIDPKHKRSGTSGLHAGLRAAVDGSFVQGRARLERPISSFGVKRTRLSFYYLPDPVFTVTPGDQVSIGEIYCQLDTGYSGAWVFLEQGGLYGRGGVNVALPPPAASGFTRVVIDIDWTRDPAVATFTVGSQQIQAALAPTCVGSIEMQAVIGAASYSYGGRFDVYYDDVALVVE